MITIENLSFSYTNSEPFLLRKINLEIAQGEYVSILGENGCGKSTLSRLILGLLQPNAGKVLNTAKRIGYVPQKTDFLNSQFPITVQEMLNCYRKILKIRDSGTVEKALRMVKMEQTRNSLIGTLSGGQCQKIFIARALMGNPDLLMLDEPSTGVDVKSQKEIYGLIRDLNRKSGITVISVEHNLDAAVKNSTLIYHLSGGNGHLCTPEQYMDEYFRPYKEDTNNAQL